VRLRVARGLRVLAAPGRIAVRVATGDALALDSRLPARDRERRAGDVEVRKGDVLRAVNLEAPTPVEDDPRNVGDIGGGDGQVRLVRDRGDRLVKILGDLGQPDVLIVAVGARQQLQDGARARSADGVRQRVLAAGRPVSAGAAALSRRRDGDGLPSQAEL